MHDSILHDASYTGLIELKGPQLVLKSLLGSVSDLQGQGAGARRYSTGVRTCDTKMYKPKQYPFGFIGPVIIMWRPKEDATQNEEGEGAGKGEGEGAVPSPKSAKNNQKKPKRTKKQNSQSSVYQ